MITITKPQLKPIADGIRAQLAQFTKNGGQIAASQVFSLTEDLPANVAAEVEAYGPFLFKGDGTFSAQGKPFKFTSGAEQVIVPGEIKGTYTATADKATLTFDKGDQIEAGVKVIFFIGEHFTSLTIDANGVTVGADKSAGSIQIGFGPTAPAAPTTTRSSATARSWGRARPQATPTAASPPGQATPTGCEL